MAQISGFTYEIRNGSIITGFTFLKLGIGLMLPKIVKKMAGLIQFKRFQSECLLLLPSNDYSVDHFRTKPK